MNAPSNLRIKFAVKLATFAATTLVSGGCDLGTKHWAESTLAATPGHTATVFHPWLEISLAYNHGTAFSLIGDLGVGRLILGVLAFVLVIGLGWLATRGDATTVDRLALGAIAGGAIGNGVDRALRGTWAWAAPEGVVDFLKINYPWGGSWPLFNIADALIAVGVGVIVLRRLRAGRDQPPSPEPAQAA